MPPQGENGAAGRKLILVRASRGLRGLGARRATKPYVSASGVGASVTRNVVGRLPAVSITSMLRPA